MTMRWTAWAAAIAVGLAAAQAFAQGQTVQLPTFQSTNVNTTVVVPDRGSVFMGGVNRASSGRNEFGVPILDKLPYVNRLFKNVGIGQQYSAAPIRMTAYIHDFDEMEEQLLGQPPSTLGMSGRLGQTPAQIAAHSLMPRDPVAAVAWQPKVAETPADRPGAKLADEQARRAVAQETREDEAQKFFERGRQAEADGKANVAKIYYQMAARRATGQLKEQVLAKLEAFQGAQVGARVVQTNP
jgi:hypothetical protein